MINKTVLHPNYASILVEAKKNRDGLAYVCGQIDYQKEVLERSVESNAKRQRELISSQAELARLIYRAVLSDSDDELTSLCRELMDALVAENVKN